MDNVKNPEKEDNDVKPEVKVEDEQPSVKVEGTSDETALDDNDSQQNVHNVVPVTDSEDTKDSAGASSVKNESADEPSTSAETKPEVASEENLDASILQKEPLFAEICSFFNYFSCYLSMKPITFPSLERMFMATETEEEVDKELLELHLTLMRKIGYKSARGDRWETFLQKFLMFIKSEEESILLERDGYGNLPLSTKLEILFQLCVRQFDHNIKFKETIFNTLGYNELRLAPVGKDKNSLNYFYQRDSDLNVRVYTQEPEDESGGTWSLVVRSHEDLQKLIENLKRVDFGLNLDENDDELDETEALEVAASKKTSPSKHQNGASKKQKEEHDPDFWKILKPEVAQKYYDYLAKRNTFHDVAKDGTDINKKKNEKLAKKEAKVAAASQQLSQKDEKAASEDKEIEEQDPEDSQQGKDDAEATDEPDIPPELSEDEGTKRRILPRRSARSNAINNLQKITTPKRKPVVEEKPKEETEEESEEEDDFDDADDSERSLNSSDEEFNIGNGKKKSARPKKSRQQKTDPDGEIKRKKKKKKQPAMVFEGDTSEEEVEIEVKERKKATIHSLCMKCNKANHPEVLLLCDMCDDPWHTYCNLPSLWYVPDDDWFCPKCHHAMLVDRLSKLEVELCDALTVKQAEDTKKMAAAERLKREMEYIGVSLNNVIPQSGSKYAEYSDEVSESTEGEDDGQRKSKKRAMKKVMGRSRKREREQFYGPIVTIAEGRTRRHVKKVDYNFSAYDEQLQEAMDVITEPPVNPKYENDHRPAGGAGLGKDMSNIYDADRKRRHSDEYDENDQPAPKKSRKKTKHRLTNLDVDNATEESESDYQASEQGDSAEAEPSEDEYLPSDDDIAKRRSTRRRSDAKFIDDGSDSDYNPSGKKRGKPLFRRSGGRKWGKGGSDGDTEEEDFVSGSSDDGYKKKRKPAKEKPRKRRVVESDDGVSNESESGAGEYSGSDDTPTKISAATGRPMRKAAAKAVLKEESDDELDEELSTKADAKDKRPVGALSRKINQDDEFEPDEEEEQLLDEDEIEAEEELENEAVDENADDDGEESSSAGDEDELPTMVAKRRAPTPPIKTPPKKAAAPKLKEKSVSVESQPEQRRSTRSPIKKQTSIEQRPVPMHTPTPPMAKPIPISVSQPSSSGYQPQFTQPPPVSTVYSPYSHGSHHPRFAPPPNAYGPPPGYYPPPNSYGHPMGPPMMPTYVMQPPPGNYYGHHPQFAPNPMMDPMHAHIQHSPFGLQPIQMQQPSDSDGLAQAITGAMNTDL